LKCCIRCNGCTYILHMSFPMFHLFS
jgi:hypothetical protein